MSVFKNIWDLVTQRQDTSFMFDADMWEPDLQRAYLKRMAIDTNVNFIARSFTQSEFKVMDGKKSDRNSELYYRLNVRPNANQSSSSSGMISSTNSFTIMKCWSSRATPETY
ncbi:hypothetical protein [Schleiferilactobacillus harbinensis]|uniref:hypothetical protein n=1 Tax=Schleiferilactobacillus harbinensis TaxID=304207 RepID=UPI00186BA63B|nr:hypothetical protein [Schleiferilactobacillus harbinensis]